MASRSPIINIAIIGSGIAGLTTAIALLKHPHIRVQIYEQATALREIGASIALAPNGLRTLERLGLEKAIDDEIAYRGPSNIPMIYKHWKTNEVLGEDYHDAVTEHKHRTARYLRAHLQEALLEAVPREIIYLNKKFSSVEVDSEEVVVSFADGSVVQADILIGADGLRSGVRQFLVPDLRLKWSGLTAFRGVFDYELVRDIPELPQDSVHWWGPNTNFFASRLGKNKYTVVGGITSDPGSTHAQYNNVEWDQEANIKLLRDLYTDWNPLVRELVNRTPDIRFYPNLSIEGPLRTWVFKDRITLIGDAAHAHGGAYATGGSLAIDDAFTISLAINHIFPPSSAQKPTATEIKKALYLYEAARKKHAERLLAIVHQKIIDSAANAGKEVTDETLRSRAAQRPDTVWLNEHDVVAKFEEVVRSRMPEGLVQISQSIDRDRGVEPDY